MKTLFQATTAHTNTTRTHRTAEKGKIIKWTQHIQHNYKETI